MPAEATNILGFTLYLKVRILLLPEVVVAWEGLIWRRLRRITVTSPLIFHLLSPISHDVANIVTVLRVAWPIGIGSWEVQVVDFVTIPSD
jgi:hypothetical protein